MSGYLQRLVATAMDSAPSVRPLPKPMFAASKPAAEGSSLFGNTEVSTAHRSTYSPLPAADALPPKDKSAPQVVDRSLRSPDTTPIPSKEGAEARFQPLLPRWPEIALSAKSDAAAGLTASHQANQAAEPPELAEGSPAAVFVKPLHVPLLREATPTARNEPAPLLQSPSATPLPGKGRSDLPPRGAEREADEIQIHIGRIEVTAVQQAPPRTLSKPAHEGPSLSDYLKRRNRRA